MKRDRILTLDEARKLAEENMKKECPCCKKDEEIKEDDRKHN